MYTLQGKTEKMVSRGDNLLDSQLWAICYGYFPCLQIASSKHTISWKMSGLGQLRAKPETSCFLSSFFQTESNHLITFVLRS